MAKYDMNKGPKADGKGMEKISETTPGESVQGEAKASVPGGESKKGSWIDIEGPNSAKK